MEKNGSWEDEVNGPVAFILYHSPDSDLSKSTSCPFKVRSESLVENGVILRDKIRSTIAIVVPPTTIAFPLVKPPWSRIARASSSLMISTSN